MSNLVIDFNHALLVSAKSQIGRMAFLPHKQFCGKPLDEDRLEDVVERSTQNDDWLKVYDGILAGYNLNEQETVEMKQKISHLTFPEPIPGFKRSLALQLQIKVLREHNKWLYMVHLLLHLAMAAKNDRTFVRFLTN